MVKITNLQIVTTKKYSELNKSNKNVVLYIIYFVILFQLFTICVYLKKKFGNYLWGFNLIEDKKYLEWKVINLMRKID